MRCWVFPRPDPNNPYQALLAASLASRGVETRSGPKLTPLWALRVPRGDAVHLHWIEFLIHYDRGAPWLRRAAMALRTANLLASLALLRLRRVPVVWTVHNIAPHEPRAPRLERLAMRLTGRLASTLHVHSRWAGERVVAELGVDPAKVMVGHHGNYLDSYGGESSRAEARRRLDLAPEARVYLAFGAIRPYKRIAEAIAEFASLADPEAVLIVAGRVKEDALRARIEAAAAADPRVRLDFGFVPEAQVAELFAASDAALLNYAEVFSSGALMAALSTGTPVVAPALGTTAEIAGPPAVEAFEPGELAAALARVVGGDPERRREAALAAARACDWDLVAARLAAAFGTSGGR